MAWGRGRGFRPTGRGRALKPVGGPADNPCWSGHRPMPMLRTVVALVALLAIGCARPKQAPPVSVAAAQKAGPAPLYPDPDRTPGVANPEVTQENIHQTICRPHWAEAVRPRVSYTNALKRQQMQEYGDTVPDPHARCVPHSAKPRCYEEDHFISLELGGDPRD